MRYLIPFLLLMYGNAVADFQVEFGPTHLSTDWADGSMIVVNERWDKWLVGMGHISKQKVLPRWEKRHGYPEVEIDRNLFFHGQRLLKWRKFELGIGAAFFQNTNRALGKNITVSSSLSYHFNNDFSINYRHFSNAGSGTPNMGQDAITLGWTF